MTKIARGRGAESRGNKVYAALLDHIRSGALAPGARIREGEVAAILDVSRTPVREALARLQERGLIENTGGALSVVALDRPQIMALYAMRAVLEGAAARFAAENASVSDLTSLEHISTLFARRRDDAAGFAEVNAAFHRAIYDAAHNGYLTRMLDDLNDSLTLLPDTTFSVPGRVAEAEVEHADILAAILARDAEAAEKSARRHIDTALRARLELLFSLRRPEPT